MEIIRKRVLILILSVVTILLLDYSCQIRRVFNFPYPGCCLTRSWITCGIYVIIWNISNIDSINKRVNKPNEMSGIVNFLLGIVTCGIWMFIWYYNNTKKLYEIQVSQGNPMANDNSISNLLLFIFGPLTCGITYLIGSRSN